MDFMAVALSTWLGIGFLPLIATATALISTGVLFVLIGRWRATWLAIMACIALTGLWAAHRSGELTGISDDGRIVVDEVAGAALLLTLAGLRRPWHIAALLVGFAVIDGLKPWPMSAIEDAPGAVGVMGDYLALGLLMGLAVLAVRRARAHLKEPSGWRRGS